MTDWIGCSLCGRRFLIAEGDCEWIEGRGFRWSCPACLIGAPIERKRTMQAFMLEIEVADSAVAKFYAKLGELAGHAGLFRVRSIEVVDKGPDETEPQPKKRVGRPPGSKTKPREPDAAADERQLEIDGAAPKDGAEAPNGAGRKPRNALVQLPKAGES